MKIDGMDASSTSYLQNNDTSSATKIQKIETNNTKSTSQEINSTIENKMVSQITDYEKKELPVPDKLVIDAIEKANKAISGGNRKFEFSIHGKTKQIMIKVIDSDTNEIIREIPPEKTLDMVAKMWEMAGIMVDERR